MTENQSTYIPLGEVHRVRNPGKTELEKIGRSPSLSSHFEQAAPGGIA